MLGPTCAKCRTELRCKRNDVALIHFMNSDKGQGIDSIRCGDLFECPICKSEVVIGLGKSEVFGCDLTQERIKKMYAEMKTHPERYIEVKR